MLKLASALLALSSLAAPAFAADDPCHMTRSANVTFSDKAAPDIVTAHAIPGAVAPGGDTIAPNLGEGPNCVFATVVLTMTQANGGTYVSEALPVAALDYDTGHQMRPLSPDGLGKVLDAWVKAETGLSGTAPDPAGLSDAVVLPGTAEDYARIRSANVPTLCYMSEWAIKTCLANESDGTVVNVVPFYTEILN